MECVTNAHRWTQASFITAGFMRDNYARLVVRLCRVPIFNFDI